MSSLLMIALAAGAVIVGALVVVAIIASTSKPEER